ncbi:MAG: cell wall-binding repeat-containing protein [Lachnospiraceae bacterium]|nr:cell wall-binding repeat-containing protein [Lachnospiraceae bacterium]
MKKYVRKALTVILILSVCIGALATNVLAWSGLDIDIDRFTPGVDYADGEVLVTFEDDIEDKSIVYQVAEEFNCTVESICYWGKWHGGKIVHMLINDDRSVKQAIIDLETSPYVQYAEVDALYRLAGDPSFKPEEKVPYSGLLLEWEKFTPGVDYADGEVLVTFADSLEDKAVVYEVAEAFNCEVESICYWGDWEGGKIAHLLIRDDRSVKEAIADLESSEYVKYAEVDALYQLASVPDDTLIADQWYLEKISVDKAWNDSKSDGQVTIAVLDDKVNADHPDLSANILTDYAYDAVSQQSMVYHSGVHGTSVAGVISAVADNGNGIAGVSYNANIIPINIVEPDSFYVRSSSITNAYRYLIDEVPSDVNVRIINMSIYTSDTYDRAMDLLMFEAEANGIINVASGGAAWDTDPRPPMVYPADYDACISVTPSDREDNVADFALCGVGKDIAAPGVDILTISDGDSVTQNGASMSAPIVSGVLALMFAADPDLTIPEAKYILYSSSDPISIPEGVTAGNYGRGRINAHKAVWRASYGYWKRLAGNSRYETMAAVSQEGWEDGSCDTVVVARGNAFPDALSGTALAGIYDCPMLLTRSTSLPPETAAEIRRLGAQHVIILGAPEVVSDEVVTAIRQISGVRSVERYYGNNRYETCAAVYRAGIGEWSDMAIIANGSSPADALSGSAYAYATHSPIFLVHSDEDLIPQIQQIINSGAFTYALIIGAEPVVSMSVENYLIARLGYNQVLRLCGSNRFVTNEKIVTWSSGLNSTLPIPQPVEALSFDYPGVARGKDENFPDALTGGAFCGHNNSVLILSQNIATEDNIAIQEIITRRKSLIEHGYMFGAADVLSEDVRALFDQATRHGA